MLVVECHLDVGCLIEVEERIMVICSMLIDRRYFFECRVWRKVRYVWRQVRYISENDFSFRKWVLESYVLGVRVLSSRTRPELPVLERGWVLFTTRDKLPSLPVSACIREFSYKDRISLWKTT